MRFSQRKGLSSVRNAIQKDSIDDALRNGLWNAFMFAFREKIKGRLKGNDTSADTFFMRFWHDFWKLPSDTVPPLYKDAVSTVREWYMKAPWYHIMDFIEYLANEVKNAKRYHRQCLGSPIVFINMCNDILEREMSAYRIVSGQIVEITDKQELESIEEALEKKGPWEASGNHISKAAGLLFNREKPDYANAAKEAISAVESTCCVITGNPNSTLGQALKVIEDNHRLHPALKEAFSKMYGYTSNESGIRHGSIEIADVSYGEAKYLLVACSAFVNYLKAISAKQKQSTLL
ncbi:MAG: hypothetical protein PVH19_02405 [Planctomycetia bacterium]|jgi:hypothetical protein